MATRIFARSFLASNRTFCSSISRSHSSLYAPTPSFSLLRLRPLVSVVSNNFRNASVSTTVRGFSTRRTTSSLNDSNPNWSNRPPTETILLDGCDFEHWLVVMEKPEGDPTRDEIIDGYVKTLAKIVGSEAEARMKLYSVSTRCYYAFGALVSEEDSYKLKELEGVRWVLPDSYLDVRNKDYGGEPVIDGVPVPYDPKYHEEWIRNNSRANERNRRNDRPRNFDRSRNFERRRENMQTQGGPRGPPPNMGGLPPDNMGGHGGPPPNNMGGPSNNFGGPRGPPPNMGGPPPGNMGGHGGPPPSNMGGPSNNFGGPQNNVALPPSNNWGGQPHSTGGPTNYGGAQPNNWQGQPPSYNSPNMGGMPNNAPNYQQQMNGPNSGGMPYQAGPGPNRGNQNSYGPNGGGGNPYQTQNMPGRDMPPPPTNY